MPRNGPAGSWSSLSPTTDISAASAWGLLVEPTLRAASALWAVVSIEDTITMCSPWPSRRQASAV
ncbi:hypothetical protein AB0N23_01700 [Streptomyces sp. NPDC052644]